MSVQRPCRAPFGKPITIGGGASYSWNKKMLWGYWFFSAIGGCIYAGTFRISMEYWTVSEAHESIGRDAINTSICVLTFEILSLELIKNIGISTDNTVGITPCLNHLQNGDQSSLFQHLFENRCSIHTYIRTHNLHRKKLEIPCWDNIGKHVVK